MNRASRQASTHVHTLTIQRNSIAMREQQAGRQAGCESHSLPSYCVSPTSAAASPHARPVSLYSINQSINQSCTGVAVAINECRAARHTLGNSRLKRYLQAANNRTISHDRALVASPEGPGRGQGVMAVSEHPLS